MPNSKPVINLVQKGVVEGNEGCIRNLESMLETAREGKLTDIAIVAYDTEGYCHSNFYVHRSALGLVGSLNRLIYRIVSDMN